MCVETAPWGARSSVQAVSAPKDNKFAVKPRSGSLLKPAKKVYSMKMLWVMSPVPGSPATLPEVRRCPKHTEPTGSRCGRVGCAWSPRGRPGWKQCSASDAARSQEESRVAQIRLLPSSTVQRHGVYRQRAVGGLRGQAFLAGGLLPEPKMQAYPPGANNIGQPIRFGAAIKSRQGLRPAVEGIDAGHGAPQGGHVVLMNGAFRWKRRCPWGKKIAAASGLTLAEGELPQRRAFGCVI